MVFREGRTKAVGNITKMIPKAPPGQHQKQKSTKSQQHQQQRQEHQQQRQEQQQQLQQAESATGLVAAPEALLASNGLSASGSGKRRGGRRQASRTAQATTVEPAEC